MKGSMDIDVCKQVDRTGSRLSYTAESWFRVCGTNDREDRKKRSVEDERRSKQEEIGDANRSILNQASGLHEVQNTKTKPNTTDAKKNERKTET